jgi:tight adherence protein B
MVVLCIFFAGVFTIFLISLLIMLRSEPDEQEGRIRARFAALRHTGSASFAGLEDLLKKTPATHGRLSQLLTQHHLAGKVETLALRAARPITPANFLRRCGLCAASGLGLGLLVTHSLLPSIAAAFALFPVPVLVLQIQGKRRLAAFNSSLPEVIDMMSRSLRAGHALVAAISIVAEQSPEPARTEFAEVFRQQNFGLPLRDAMLQMLDRVPSQDLRVLVTAILVQKDTGGNLTQILDRTSSVVRERVKLQGDIRVHTAQGRMTGWILCLLPVVMLVLINLINPGYSKSLTDNPFGRKLLYTGATLLVVGALLIRRIVNGIEI